MNGKRLALIALTPLGGLLIALAYGNYAWGQAIAVVLVAVMVLSAAFLGAARSQPSSQRPGRPAEKARRKQEAATKRANVIAVVGNLLRMGNVTYDRRALERFVNEAWPLIEEDPDPLRWAKFFAASLRMSCEETVAFAEIAL